jgi:transporter family protein
MATIFCWGMWGFLLKFATKYLDWRQIYVVNSLITILTSILIFVALKPSIDFHSRGFRYAIFAGLLGTTALICFYSALSVENAIIVVPLTSMYPIITILLSYLILNERLTPLKGVGIILGLISIFLVSV